MRNLWQTGDTDCLLKDTLEERYLIEPRILCWMIYLTTRAAFLLAIKPSLIVYTPPLILVTSPSSPLSPSLYSPSTLPYSSPFPLFPIIPFFAALLTLTSIFFWASSPSSPSFSLYKLQLSPVYTTLSRGMLSRLLFPESLCDGAANGFPSEPSACWVMPPLLLLHVCVCVLSLLGDVCGAVTFFVRASLKE